MSLPVSSIHLLPCSIDFDGKTPVSTYFNQRDLAPSTSGQYHGRHLKGKTYHIPDGYQGRVIQIPDYKILDSQDSESSTHSKHRVVKSIAVSTFDSFKIWAHDDEPLDEDPTPLAISYLPLAHKIHEPISLTAVEKKLADRRGGPSSQTTDSDVDVEKKRKQETDEESASKSQKQR